MSHIIRRMKIDDCKDATHVITLAWNETYKGIVPDEVLEKMFHNEEERTEKLKKRLKENKNLHQFILEVDHKIVGIMNVGLSEEKDFDHCGEIYAIYILKEYHGNHYGKELVEVGIQELKSMNCDKMLIACLEKNPTNEFYKHIGGKFIKHRVFERLQLPENVYYYDLRNQKENNESKGK